MKKAGSTQMRVMLIQPPMFHQKLHLAPNLGLAYIAAVLERDGVEVGVVDAAAEDLGYKEISERIRAFNPRIVAAGGQTPVSHRALIIFKNVKAEVDPGIITVAGGPHFTFTDEESLERCPELDVVVRGEAEETMLELCRRVAAGGSLEGIRGITFRGPDGEAVRNQDRDPIPDLDSLPFPAWHLFPTEKYHWAGNRMLAISSSRGCPFRCPHCITWKVHKGVRQRRASRIVEEMAWAKKNFGHDTFFFQDDASFLERGQMEAFLEELERSGERFFWYYETREDVFQSYSDLWVRLKRNGLFKIVFGLETPDPRMREHYGKKGFEKASVERTMDALEKELDVLVSVYLLFGLPEETLESVEATLQYGRYLYPDHCSFIVGTMVVPFPGTEMYADLKRRGMLNSLDWRDYGFDKSIIKTSIPPERLSEIFAKFWTGTYVRPKVFLKQMQFYLSGNRFRRSMAKQYVKMAREMISDVRKMRGKEKTDF